MRKLFPLLSVAVLFTGLSAFAKEGKEITITGEGICAKCGLKEAKACQNVVIVTKDGKETKYYLEGPVSKKYHGSSGICTASKDAMIKTKVVGTVEEKDGKQVITATTVEKAD